VHDPIVVVQYASRLDCIERNNSFYHSAQGRGFANCLCSQLKYQHLWLILELYTEILNKSGTFIIIDYTTTEGGGGCASNLECSKLHAPIALRCDQEASFTSTTTLELHKDSKSVPCTFNPAHQATVNAGWLVQTGDLLLICIEGGSSWVAHNKKADGTLWRANQEEKIIHIKLVLIFSVCCGRLSKNPAT